MDETYLLIIENENNVPKIVHIDQKLEYRKQNILTFFELYNIKTSVAWTKTK
jgi:hypothetical protein